MTVGETMTRMSVEEFKCWQLYEQEFGPLHSAYRFELAVARAVIPFLKDVTLATYMTWPKKIESEEPASLEGLFGLLGGAKKKPS